MRILAEETCAICVDIQEKLMAAMYEADACEEKAVALLKGLKLLEVPVIISQQYTKGLGGSKPSIYEAAGTTEYFDKTTFDACKDEKIMDAVRKSGKKNVILMGTEAHICVLQTAVSLKEQGYQPILVADAIASRREYDKNMGIQRAIQEGVLITTVESVLFEMTVDKNHPHFKTISKLIK